MSASTPASSPAPVRDVRPARPRRRRPGPGWVPRQHGAWAMLVVPPVVGGVLGGWSWRHVLLLVAWLVGYLAYHAAGLWLRSGRKVRYRAPVAVYGAAGLMLLGVLLGVAPHLLLWAPAFAPLLGVSLYASLRRADRSWWNDTVTVLAAALLTPVAAGLGTGDPRSGAVWTATVVLAVYFLGTVPYVKSLIRERDDPRVLRGSVVYHVVAAVAGALVHPLLGFVGALLALRAWLVPHRWPQVRPAVIGAGEVVATLAVTAAVLRVV
ncbi:YwiC-like family protein [Cellulomonas sp. zg-ZUI222]|uniref:YwiC-like family protein n=1 Tax=Cellulomonas TaxID=1707 RepID=UPI001A949D29|nr:MULTISPECIES: YwiC-like family protein [Cellulomonas]MBO0900940.1 YwiC-like family protein [Cellulomonas sp. zg-ZUI22]MBO0921595.1 YwiC-like family protein [Cellulomonas wangleii]